MNKWLHYLYAVEKQFQLNRCVLTKLLVKYKSSDVEYSFEIDLFEEDNL